MNTVVTATNVLDVARGWLGFNEADGSHKQILNVYNSHKPLARGYTMKPTDDWCDAFVSAVAIKADAVNLIGTEVGCGKHIEIFKSKGIWIEDGTIQPKTGDIILFNWEDTTQPNDGSANHIGYVEKISGSSIVTIEGNKSNKVDRRIIPLGWGQIRGFARPKYSATLPLKPLEVVAQEVILGKWGSGEDRKKKLTNAGYDYVAVQKKVNLLLKK